MNKDKLFADIYVHFQLDSLFDYRNKVERELRDISGVFSVHFAMDYCRNAMFVACNPKAVCSDVLLEILRES